MNKISVNCNQIERLKDVLNELDTYPREIAKVLGYRTPWESWRVTVATAVINEEFHA